jgi:hypothetical protein
MAVKGMFLKLLEFFIETKAMLEGYEKDPI